MALEDNAGTTDSSTTATVETTAAPSMEETVRSTLASINSRSSDDKAGAPDAAADTQSGTGRARDAAGKFAKAAPAGDGSAVSATPKAEAPATTDPTVADQWGEAPKSWKAERKAEWAALSPTVREEIHRREQDFFKGIEQYRGESNTFRALDSVIRPHADIIQAAGRNAVEHIKDLFGMERSLVSGSDQDKVATLLQIAANVGIKPQAIVDGLNNPRQAPAQDPRYDALSRELQETRAQLSEVRLAPVLSQIESFLADPKNEFAKEPEVQEEMERLISSGITRDLKTAYDKACRLSDSVQAKLEQRKQQEEAKRRADLAANARKVSSINVRTRGATPAGQAAKGTMEDTARAKFRELSGG